LVLTAVVPAFVLILDTAAKYRELTATQIKQNAIVAARAIASEQDRVLENAHEFLVTISQVPQIKENDRAACRKILAGLLEPRYADLVVADRNGNPLCTALSPGNSLAHSKGRHHSRSIESYDFAVGDIRRHPSGIKTLLDVSYPILDHPAGVVRAVVSASLDLSWINRVAVETHLYPGATFTLIGSNGDVLLRHPDGSDWIGKSIFSEAIQPHTVAANTEQTIEAMGPDGVNRLFALSRLKNAVGGQTVYAAVDLPMPVAFAKTKEILIQNLLALAILSAIILGFTWYGTDVLVLRRIRDIIAATRKMAAGDLGARTSLSYDDNELGQMARAFDNLAKTLQKREVEAIESTKHIQQQRQQQEALYDLNRSITSTLDVASVLRTLLDQISALFSSYAVTVSWINPQSKTLETIAYRGVNEADPTTEELASAESLPLLVLQEKSLVAITDAAADPRASDHEFLLRHRWTSYLGLPLIAKEETLGVLSFYSREKREFSQQDINFLNALVNEAAIALYNSRLFEQTQKQAAELEKSNKIKDEFLGVMSHELRTPLNIIMNYSEALRMGTFGEISPDQAQGTEKIRVQAGHLLALINGILEITKIESDAVCVETRPIDLKEFMAELKSDYMLPLEKEIALLWNDNSDLPKIVSDRIKLKQIVTNLINNAIKFTDHGSVTVSAGIADSGQLLEISVVDTGPGIPHELLPFVFDKFRQIDSATTRNYSGAGLGLYIVKNFVNLLGGTIEVRSKPGEGSVFTVRLAIQSDHGRVEAPSLLPNPAEAYTL
jgi:signal transduction histidine kinase